MNVRRGKSPSVDYRRWSREVYPYLEGMSHTQVCENRRKWVAAVGYLGSKWRMMQRDVRKVRDVPTLTVARAA